MSDHSKGHGPLVAIWGAAGVFVLGFVGAEALFAPGEMGLSTGATLIPSAVAAVGAFLYLLRTPAAEADAAEEAKPRETQSPTPLFGRSQHRARPGARRAA